MQTIGSIRSGAPDIIRVFETMVDLSIVLLCLCAVCLLLYQKHTAADRVRAASASGADLEDVYVELKEKLLAMNESDDEQDYRYLRHRVDTALARLVERHLHLVLDVEARTPDVRRALGLAAADATQGGATVDPAALRAIDLAATRPDVLLYLCFFLYQGGRAKDIGRLKSDPELMLRILDHLVNVRGYPPGQFLMGFVMKYGAKAEAPVHLAEAMRLLRAAERQGVGSATLELRHLAKHAPLRNVKARPRANQVAEAGSR